MVVPRFTTRVDRVNGYQTLTLPGVRCLTRAFCNVLRHFAMQRYVTIKRFVALQNYSWAVSRKTFCETNRCISRTLRSGLWAYLIHSSVYTFLVLGNHQDNGAVFVAIHFPTLLNRCECIGWKCIAPGACSHTSKNSKQISHLPVL